MNIIPIDLAPRAPVVFAIDRTLSMATQDCPDGQSRWRYATAAVRAAMLDLARQERPVTLMAFGRSIDVIEHAKPEDIEKLRMGDAACCTGQAALEAIFYASSSDPSVPPGAAVIISDGCPDEDTMLGRSFMSQRELFMRTAFTRIVFLTVGVVSPELSVFASLWPNNARLEDVLARDAVKYGDATQELALADTEPPPPDDAPTPKRSKSKR